MVVSPRCLERGSSLRLRNTINVRDDRPPSKQAARSALPNSAVASAACLEGGPGPVTPSTKSHRLPTLRRQFEFRKLESRSNRASDQGPIAVALGRLPRMRWNDRLRRFAGCQIRAELHAALPAIVSNLQRQRGACVIMPDLHRVDAMPVRAFAVRQQEIDRGRSRASIGVHALVAKRFAIMAAFRMRLEVQPRDDIGGVVRQRHQDLFLRSRNSPNTSAALAPFMCSFAATDGSSARRNTLAFFSSPSSTGIVGLFSARSRVTSSARAFSAGLSPSTVSANLTFDAVYSWPQ